MRGACVTYLPRFTPALAFCSALRVTRVFACHRSSDGLSLFVSSTDGYVTRIHFKRGELGITIPESDVPSQTRRLHPVIYGWQPEAAGVDELPGRTPRSIPPSVSDVCAQGERQAPTRHGDEDTNRVVPIEAQATGPGDGEVATKPTKKIVPTLVTFLPTTASGQHSQVDVGPVTQPSIAVPPSPTPSVDDLQSERKKRRIAPTLVHGDVATAHVRDADADAVSGAADVCNASSPIGDGASPSAQSVVKPASANGQDRTPKKKRLAPTLVSAL